MNAISSMANDYMGMVLGLTVSDGARGVFGVETERRNRCEEGYSMEWPTIVLRRGNAWWISCKPGLLEKVTERLNTAEEPESGFSDRFITGLREALEKEGVGVTSFANALCYVPSGVVPHSPTDFDVRRITPEDDVSVFGYGVPEESVRFGTAFGSFVDGKVVGYAEATPLATVTEATGVMLVGIATLEAFRGRGIARANLGALTNHVLSIGKLPWYHCNASNTASQRTAESCGYRRYGELLRFHA